MSSALLLAICTKKAIDIHSIVADLLSKHGVKTEEKV